MKNLLLGSDYFGVVLTLVSYGAGIRISRKLKAVLWNPLLIAIVLTVSVLSLLHIDYPAYRRSTKGISFLLTPATICLAVPLYEKTKLLKMHFAAVCAGIAAGTAASLGSVFLFARLFRLDHVSYVTLLPKSVTTAIGIGVSEELQGNPSLTAAAIIFTGVFGSVFAETICARFHITDPIAKGVAIGTSSHAIGTAKAMELGETEGAMSSLSIVVTGMLTVAGAGIFAGFL